MNIKFHKKFNWDGALKSSRDYVHKINTFVGRSTRYITTSFSISMNPVSFVSQTSTTFSFCEKKLSFHSRPYFHEVISESSVSRFKTNFGKRAHFCKRASRQIGSFSLLLFCRSSQSTWLLCAYLQVSDFPSHSRRFVSHLTYSSASITDNRNWRKPLEQRVCLKSRFSTESYGDVILGNISAHIIISTW